MEHKNIEKIKLWVSGAVIVALFVLGFMYTSWVENSQKKPVGGKLPTNAINVIDQGNGWYSFDLKVGDSIVTVVHFFEKPPVKEDTAQPIEDEFLRDWQKDSQNNSQEDMDGGDEDRGENDHDPDD